MENKYQIEGLIPKTVIDRIQNLLGVPVKSQNSDRVRGIWEVPEQKLAEILSELKKAGVKDFRIRKFAVHFYIAVGNIILDSVIENVSKYTVGKINQHIDPFSEGKILGFIVESENSGHIQNILKKKDVNKYIGFECFLMTGDMNYD